MTTIEIDNERFKVIRENIFKVDCRKCYFCGLKCPRSDDWPYYPLCDDYEDYDTGAYFEKID